jgi:hypothetical protein
MYECRGGVLRAMHASQCAPALLFVSDTNLHYVDYMWDHNNKAGDAEIVSESVREATVTVTAAVMVRPRV